MPAISQIIIVSLITIFTLYVFDSFGGIEALQLSKFKTFNKVADCIFCLSFWVSVVVSITLMFICQDVSYLWCMLLSPPLNAIVYAKS
jgi:hypothetical protein